MACSIIYMGVGADWERSGLAPNVRGCNKYRRGLGLDISRTWCFQGIPNTFYLVVGNLGLP